MGAVVHFKISNSAVSLVVARSVAFALSFAVGLSAHANGFVKKPNEVYGKLSFSADKKTAEGNAAESYEKNTAQLQAYGELGLPLPWSSQVALSTSLRQVTRKSIETKDSFESRGFSDTQLMFKSLVHEGEIARPRGLPVSFLLAADFGLTLPTTRKKYRTGNESLLSEGVAAERAFLVSPIDRGALQSRQGLGMSFLAAGKWLSLAYQTHSDTTLAAAGRTSRAEMGTSLPHASWVQLSFQSATDREIAAQSIGSQKGQTEENALGLSTGYTFLPGWAAEAGITFINTRHFYQWSAGVSYRTM